MKPLEPPDSIHLEAAEGWVELGNHLEANEELEQITSENRAHPAVLEVRWQIYAKAENWDASPYIASAPPDQREQCAGHRVGLEPLPADGLQPVDALTEIHGLDRQ